VIGVDLGEETAKTGAMPFGSRPLNRLRTAVLAFVLLGMVACGGAHKADPQNPVAYDPRHAASRVVLCTGGASYDPARNECVGVSESSSGQPTSQPPTKGSSN